MFGGADLLVELDVLHHFECESEVAEKTVDTEQADDAEVAEHPVQRANAVFADDLAKTKKVSKGDCRRAG